MSLVLLFEPDLDAREGIRAQLDAFGLDVIEAASAREAELLSSLYDPELTVFARRLATPTRPRRRVGAPARPRGSRRSCSGRSR